MDASYLLAAARYSELNPVRANLVTHPSEYRWSSAQAHFDGEDDVLVKAAPLLDLSGNWGEFLSEDPKGGEAVKIKRHERTGRPLGSKAFLLLSEALTGRNLQKRKPGPQGIRKMELHN
jgi:putative transposase